jgi:hypothetical protein
LRALSLDAQADGASRTSERLVLAYDRAHAAKLAKHQELEGTLF